MAAKLARLIYRMLRFGMQFVDQGAEVYEAAHRQREIHNLNRRPPIWDSKSFRPQQRSGSLPTTRN
jgi:hypothetical protein